MMNALHRLSLVKIYSMRLWIHSAALLAVLAGYSALLVVHQRAASLKRQQAHNELVQIAMDRFSDPSLSNERLKLLQEGFRAINVKLLFKELNGSSSYSLQRSSLVGMPKEEARSWLINQRLMVSETSLRRSDGKKFHIKLIQDISPSIQQESTIFWVLIAAAGVASLFTSFLLRVVLHYGLTKPLNGFRTEISNLGRTPQDLKRVDLAAQPDELKPIGAAFNDFQDRLLQAWNHQRIFMDSVAHELRTPVTLISGRAQSILRHREPVHIDSSIGVILSESNRMATLISDLLDLARQDMNDLRLRCKPIAADDVLLELYERMNDNADGRLRIDLGNHACDQPPIGFGDPDRLQQCLTALVDNALKYSPSGSPITLSSSSREDGILILHVRDEGYGVPDGEVEDIFKRFFRGSAAASHSESRGSGIGLSIVKLLIEAMGGSVRVCSYVGGGADFQLHLKPAPASIN